MIGALIFITWMFGVFATGIVYMSTDVEPATVPVLIMVLPVINVLFPIGYILFLIIKGIRFLLKWDCSDAKKELNDVMKIFKF